MDDNLIGKNSKPKAFGKGRGRLAIYLLIYHLLLLSIFNIYIKSFLSSSLNIALIESYWEVTKTGQYGATAIYFSTDQKHHNYHASWKLWGWAGCYHVYKLCYAESCRKYLLGKSQICVAHIQNGETASLFFYRIGVPGSQSMEPWFEASRCFYDAFIFNNLFQWATVYGQSWKYVNK